ncbi:MAG: Amidohydrolase family [Puniceicoccaceae bacterium 5H]|nr:MAG: Amidohydrolase family [Puniceicoccaceae bacterium 5H]
MWIDVNASHGHWPFDRLPRRTLPELEAHLVSEGIERALVSPIEPLFLADPDPSNRELLAGCRACPHLVPVPVLHLGMPDWRENLEAYQQQTDLKAVKLYPNFHHYPLSSRACRDLVRILRDTGTRLIVNIRMFDERNGYTGLKIPGVKVKHLAGFAERHADFPFLCTGLYRPEILELADRCVDFRTDLSFADWHDLINQLLTRLRPEQLLFGSHTPLFVTRAATLKLELAPIPEAIRAQIGRENARTFFRL